MRKIAHIHTNDGITVVLNGRPYTAARDVPYYDEVVEAVAGRSPKSEEEVLDIFERASVRLKAVTGLTPDMLYSGGVITFRGEVLHNYASERLISLIEAGLDHKPLAMFLEKLQDNPSKRVVDNLYSFLEKGAIPLASDGDFLAYKAVREDFMDIYSGTFDNRIGTVCQMQRNRVDEDPNRTCSNGLHVCSFEYLKVFAHTNGHVMIVKVNPADVVAIPADYSDTKMRVSRYQVIGEVEGYYRDSQRDELREISTKGSGVMEAKFRLEDENGVELDTFYTLEEAKIQARRSAEELDEIINVLDNEDMVVWSVASDGVGY
jgi:hypothetical protein